MTSPHVHNRLQAHAWEHPAQLEAAPSLSLHQGTRLNPYINYPFLDATSHALRTFTNASHAAGKHVSIYYTLRELSSHASELPVT